MKINAPGASLHFQPAAVSFSIDFFSVSLHFHQQIFGYFKVLKSCNMIEKMLVSFLNFSKP